MTNLDIISTNNKEKQLSLISEIPEPLIWHANFNSLESKKTYKSAIELFMKVLNLRSVEDFQTVTIPHIIAFRDHLKEKEYSPRTINNRLSAISSLFQHLIESQIVAINPVDGVKRMRVNQDRVESKVLSPEEVRKMLNAPDTRKVQGLRDRAILATLFYTGCRISEITTLKVKDFFQEKGFYILDFLVKGGKRNSVAIHSECSSYLLEYLQTAGHLDQENYFIFLPVRDTNFNTDKSKQKKLNQSSINRLWQKYAKITGLVGTRPHSARATFITEGLENNAPIESIQKTVGHSQIKTTQSYDKRNFKFKDSSSFAVRY